MPVVKSIWSTVHCIKLWYFIYIIISYHTGAATTSQSACPPVVFAWDKHRQDHHHHLLRPDHGGDGHQQQHHGATVDRQQLRQNSGWFLFPPSAQGKCETPSVLAPLLPRMKRHQLLAGSSETRTLAGSSFPLLPRVSVKRHQLLAGSSDTRALADSMSHFLPRAGGKKTFVAYCWYLSGNLSSVKCACETTKMKRHLFLTAFLSPFWLVVRIIIAIIDTVHHQRRWNISVKFLKRKWNHNPQSQYRKATELTIRLNGFCVWKRFLLMVLIP